MASPPRSTPANADSGESLVRLAATLPPSKQFPWYQASFGSRLTIECRQLLQEYSRIPPEQVDRHVYEMRDAAWAVFPFPCIGEFWFLTLGLSCHPRYGLLLARLKSGGGGSGSGSGSGTTAADHPAAQIIDIGTCFGQDLRKLVHDGATPAQLTGVDVFSAFEKIGQDFFCDADRFVTGERFRTADLFAPISSLTELQRSQDIVTSTMFLHSFDWDTQLNACRQMLTLARGTGSWLMGGLSASSEAGEHWLKPPWVPEGIQKNVYRHDRDSFTRMWELAGREAGMELDIWVEYERIETEARKAAEQGGANFFEGFEVKLLWYCVAIVGFQTTNP